MLFRSGVAVINQWINAIKTYTKLKYFKIINIYDLDTFMKLIKNKEINKYDVIIIKNGKVTRKPNEFPLYNLEIENKNQTSILYIYNIISNLRNICWARVVIDDYDTIHLPKNLGYINGCFTWYISSTKRYINSSGDYGLDTYYTEDCLLYDSFDMYNFQKNPIIMKLLNIRNNPNFIKQSINLNKPIIYAYKFKNKKIGRAHV